MNDATAEMKVTRLAPWFGANTSRAGEYAAALGKLRWCAVPFAGGMSELPLIQTTAGVAGDLHRHIINLARCVRDADAKSELIDRLDGTLFHPDELAAAQRECLRREAEFEGGLFAPARSMDGPPDAEWAKSYFIACWMGRGGHAGKETEFTQGLSIRYTSSGGDSAKRFQSAIECLEAWHLALKRWSFQCVDAFEIIASVNDTEGHGIYCDPPWPEAGREYRHKVGDEFHGRLSKALGRFQKCRVAIRYGDHPMIRELYRGWNVQGQSSRNQNNNDCAEMMICNFDQKPTPESVRDPVVSDREQIADNITEPAK